MKYLMMTILVPFFAIGVLAQSGASIPRSLSIADDGTILVGTSSTNANGVQEMKLIAYNPDGSIRGSVTKTIEASTPLLFTSCATSGSDAVISGTGGDPTSQNDIVAFGFDLSTIVSVGDIPSAVQDLILNPAYPNPASGATASVTFNIPKADKYKLSLRDVSGNELRIIENSILTEGDYERSISVAGLQNGTYFVVLEHSNGAITKKLLVVK